MATAVRSSDRISEATGSAAAGSRASASVISNTPPSWRTACTAEATALTRSPAARAPISGPSSVTNLRPSHTARTSVALPTPAGPDTSTPKLVPAPKVCSRCGSSRASLSHSVSLAACGWAPLSSSIWISGLEMLTCPAVDVPIAAGTPAPQVTSELGCTLTGPSGSTPVTVSSSEVQLIPTAAANARLAADVDVPGPRSRGSSETASPTVITLPSRACRSVTGGTDWVASVEPLSVTDRAP
ncbi:Uncharacterised protein [Mycobacterium tuberculosis]|nr:Uncharacterised protein [Mycobacterium tuberculosis]